MSWKTRKKILLKKKSNSAIAKPTGAPKVRKPAFVFKAGALTCGSCTTAVAEMVVVEAPVLTEQELLLKEFDCSQAEYEAAAKYAARFENKPLFARTADGEFAPCSICAGVSNFITPDLWRAIAKDIVAGKDVSMYFMDTPNTTTH